MKILAAGSIAFLFLIGIICFVTTKKLPVHSWTYYSDGHVNHSRSDYYYNKIILWITGRGESYNNAVYCKDYNDSEVWEVIQQLHDASIYKASTTNVIDKVKIVHFPVGFMDEKLGRYEITIIYVKKSNGPYFTSGIADKDGVLGIFKEFP